MPKQGAIVGDIFCPVHKTEHMSRLFIVRSRLKEKTKMNPRGKIGTTLRTNWFYCEKCKKPYKISVSVSRR